MLKVNYNINISFAKFVLSTYAHLQCYATYYFVVMNKLQIYGIKFVSLEPSGAPLTSGAPGLCPPTTYGCYATGHHRFTNSHDV